MPRSLPVMFSCRWRRRAALVVLLGVSFGLAFTQRGDAQSPRPVIVLAGTALYDEPCTSPNGVVDPNERVTVSFALQNVGTAGTAQSVTATLLATGGVTAPSEPQDYGRLNAGGLAQQREFSFTAAGQPIASTITATLQLREGASNRGTVSVTFTLGVVVLDTDPGRCTAAPRVTSPRQCGAMHCHPTRSAPFPPGTTTVSCVNAYAGFVFQFFVQDAEAPRITCPANIIRSTDANQCAATINPGLPTVTDNCPNVTVTGTRRDNQPLNAAYPRGTTTIQWQAIDAAGQEVVCQQTVTVNDTQPPVITCPPDIAVTASNSAPTVVNYAPPVATDGCQLANVNCTPPAGANFPIGTTMVNCTATDNAGNVANCSFRVTVNRQTQELPLPPAIASSDEQPGAVLAFPIFTSNAAAPQTQNTRLSITNIDPERQAFVYLFFINETCAVADGLVCLTAQQTMTFLASDLDPGATGYLIAVVVDAAGLPDQSQRADWR